MAKPTLFCLHFAGGSSYAFAEFRKRIGNTADVIPLDLPGHGRRIAEPLLTDIHRMAADLFAQVENTVTTPYAIFGHSMGALLAYLLTLRIRDASIPLPQHLFVSGRQGPSVPGAEKNVHTLPEDRFIEKVKEYGGMPDAVLAEPDLIALFVPIMRADFQAVSDYVHDFTRRPLEVPLSVMIGDKDNTTLADARKWEEVTMHPIRFHRFNGRHFFLFDHWTEIIDIIRKEMLPS